MLNFGSFFAAAPAAALGTVAPLPGLDLVVASGPGSTLRISMAAASRRLPIGHADQGGEGQRFMGDTEFNSLVFWDLSRADAPSRLVPNFAIAQRVDPAETTRWIFPIRPGVRCHDGSPFTAHALPWTFEKIRHQRAALRPAPLCPGAGRTSPPWPRRPPPPTTSSTCAPARPTCSCPTASLDP